jgi:hypothetical protein
MACEAVTNEKRKNKNVKRHNGNPKTKAQMPNQTCPEQSRRIQNPKNNPP